MKSVKEELSDLIKPHYVTAIAGMAKNTGKTTVLNSLIDQYRMEGMQLALTSIGRDGESEDVITRAKKPPIHVPKGTLIATAAGLLPHCSIDRDILETTGMNTPLGEVVIARALSDGYVQLAGASTNSGTASLVAYFGSQRVAKILIDGAFDRKSILSPKVAEAAILCTGAAMHLDMDEVVRRTAHITRTCMFDLACEGPIKTISSMPGSVRAALIDEVAGFEPYKPGDPIPPGFSNVFLRGAVTDSVAGKLANLGKRLNGISLIAEDSSKLFITQDALDRLHRKGCTIKLMSRVKLAALTINPFSACGHSFDKDAFLDKMSAESAVPVFNVVLRSADFQSRMENGKWKMEN